MGDSQAYATPLAGSGVWQVQRSACLAFLADVGLHPLRRAACDSGFRRRMGYVAQHDRRLVNKGSTIGGRRKMNNEEKVRHTFDGMEPVVKSVSVKKPKSFFGERPLTAIEMAPRVLRYQSRRDFLVFGAGALAAR